MFSQEKPGACVFDTPIGGCAFAWTRGGVDVFLLPGDDRAKISERLEATPRPPLPARRVISRVVAHLSGRSDDLRDVPVDLSGCPAFYRRVYRALRRVDPGEVTTYGELASRCRSPGAARAVGGAMGANPVPMVVPCHRVITAQRFLGGFSASGGPRLKARMLFAEGVVLDPDHAAGIAHLRQSDRRLRQVIDLAGPYLPRVGPPGDPYDVLVESIVHQQLSLKAAATIAGRVISLTSGPGYPAPGELESLSDTDLRSVGLSFPKISYLRDLASRVGDGRLDLPRLSRLDDEAVIESLTTVRGLGRWSAEMFLIFHLGCLDVLPVGDLGLRQGFQALYGLAAEPDTATIEKAAEKWRPYRSLATWYIWRSKETGGI